MDRTIAERLATLRKDAGMSQEDLAIKLGVTRQAISRWERGEVYPDTENIIMLARLYGLSIDALLGLSGGLLEQDGGKDKQAFRRRAMIAGSCAAFLVVAIVVSLLLWPKEKEYTGYLEGTVVAMANYRNEVVLQLDKKAGAEGPYFIICDLSDAGIEPGDAGVKEGDEMTVSYQFTAVGSAENKQLPDRITAESVSVHANDQ